MGWETADRVVVRFYDSSGDDQFSVLVRCDVVSGDCERVPGGPQPRGRTPARTTW